MWKACEDDLHVICDLRLDVRAQVRSGGIAAGVHLASDERRQNRGTRILLRVLHGKTDVEALVGGAAGVINDTELRSACPYQAQLVVRIHVLAVENVRGHRRDPNTVRGEHAPGLAAENLPLAGADIHPVQPHPERVGVAGHVQGCGCISEKVCLQVAGNRRAFVVCRNFEADPRVLRAESILRHYAGGRVVKRNSVKRGSDTAAHVRRAPDRSQIHESEWRELGFADT